MINNLTAKEAEILVAQHTGGWLSLDGLTALTDEAATALAKHTGGLYLPGRFKR